MAFPRRRMARPPRARKRKADWVYRGTVFDSAGGAIDDLGTYSAQLKTLAAGVAFANAAVLYDSHNYTASTVAGQFDAPRVRVWSPGRAEGGKAFIHAVQGVIIITPSVWTVGSEFRYGIRFGIFEQDASVGAFLLDPAYTMWSAATTFIAQPALWANDRMWVKEMRFCRRFATGNETVMWNLPFRFPVKRSLKPNQCFGIFTETPSGSATLIEQMWFRTLVSDEQ